MNIDRFKRLPEHIGIIPDGNRRWAVKNNMQKKDGYKYGLQPGFEMYDLCRELGIKELTFYGFTKDNNKRPKDQTTEFRRACVEAVMSLCKKDAELLVVGDYESDLFPKELIPFTRRTKFGKGGIKINFLVNYGWDWDIKDYKEGKKLRYKNTIKNIHSSEISRIDLIIRWGGRCRLSGFLPLQTVYSDFYIIDDLWPDFKKEHFYDALNWYQNQDITLGG
ncbi:dihydroorotate dehydrogenase [Clostridium tetani]|uniref:Undecaprenyl pyrophosphate synthetase n=1 Tax=Clostridium tetani (strain Massachusetts / E88) TaxID=212717 RepID=Q895B9_CLOTE|nr:undecaprenyl diphosphate synthase family protein [Clostridium tetani]AAO35921.1 undecaprenyl pyrophosphate synthetase [Clostridium tetani E88]AVP53821.1 undecaprenyl diphosphate synthase family protein [Clostridium tetani]KGI38168.1 dihydroorotate dehydrogenase [Clostridium tetani]KGI40043.1 dihydroorotate dehydrogenase [Clostridium tetani ATCC 9441]KGI45024.1 dihydroorotate dehydrogenase [Clostridium tetani]